MKLKNALILLLTATIWGVAFVAQSVGMDYVSPFTFNGVRSIIGGLVLIPVILVLDRKKKAEGKDYKAPGDRKTLILGGICCGVALCVHLISSSLVLCIQAWEKLALSQPAILSLCRSSACFLAKSAVRPSPGQ